jgi:hypothetical protein
MPATLHGDARDEGSRISRASVSTPDLVAGPSLAVSLVSSRGSS